MSGQAEPARLPLAGELTIYRAAELMPVLLGALDGREVLEINLAGVTEIDTAGVQLLMLAKKAAQAQGCQLRLGGHSAAVVEVFDLLNLATYFGDPLLVGAAKGAP
jgi:anti-sigma B factor antagonist